MRQDVFTITFGLMLYTFLLTFDSFCSQKTSRDSSGMGWCSKHQYTWSDCRQLLTIAILTADFECQFFLTDLLFIHPFSLSFSPPFLDLLSSLSLFPFSYNFVLVIKPSHIDLSVSSAPKISQKSYRLVCSTGLGLASVLLMVDALRLAEQVL